MIRQMQREDAAGGDPRGEARVQKRLLQRTRGELQKGEGRKISAGGWRQSEALRLL